MRTAPRRLLDRLGVNAPGRPIQRAACYVPTAQSPSGVGAGDAAAKAAISTLATPDRVRVYLPKDGTITLGITGRWQATIANSATAYAAWYAVPHINGAPFGQIVTNVNPNIYDDIDVASQGGNTSSHFFQWVQNESAGTYSGFFRGAAANIMTASTGEANAALPSLLGPGIEVMTGNPLWAKAGWYTIDLRYARNSTICSAVTFSERRLYAIAEAFV